MIKPFNLLRWGFKVPEEKNEVKQLTLKKKNKGLHLAEQLELYLLNENLSTERSTKFKKELHKNLT